ncbi:MAG: ABC transporter ATP-binding protein [Myxococcales bacterium]
MSEPAALEVRELSVQLGQREVLKRVSLRAESGQVTAILGPNGAGKSSLLRAVAGILDGRGQVLLHGVPAATIEPRERAKLVSFVPQNSLLRVAMPVRSVVAQGRYAHRSSVARLGPADEAAIDEALTETDTQGLAARPFTELSFGEQKRVMIARALATGARTLLLDEPTASLDVEHALRLCVLLRALAGQGRCVVVVLHHLDEALTYADEVALIKSGELIAHGPAQDIITPERVRALYGVDMVFGGGLGFRLPEASS